MARIELSNIGGGGTTLSLTTTGTSGAATLAGLVLNIPIYQGALTLTTTGTSGAATLVGDTLNIPNYATGGSPAGAAGQVQFNSTPAGSFAASANLAWDNTATQLNIGAPSAPTGKLNVKGGGTTTTVNTRLTDSGNTELLKVLDNGSTNIGANFNWDNTNSRLGIGTASPSQPLHVSGNAIITGSNGTAATIMGRDGSGNISAINLTTTGTSGAATLSGNNLNIPQYSGGGGGTPAGSAGQVQFNSTPAGSFAASASLAWDDSNTRLNIGAPSTPTGRLNVKGSGTLSSTITSIWTNSGNTELMRINDAGSVGISGLNTGATLEVNNRSSSNPSIYLLNSNTTVPNYTGVGINPNVTTNTIGLISAYGGTLGGLSLRGISSTTSTYGAINLIANVPTSNTTFGATTINGFRHNGTTGQTALSGDEIVLSVETSNSSLFGFRANGNLNIGSNFIPSARLHVRGSNTSSGTNALLVQNNRSPTPDDIYKIENNGKISYWATNTGAGTTGAQTIDKPSGTVNFAAGATALVVTNALCTTASIVFATVRTNDATATIKNVVPAAGSFTINLGAVATAETSVGFFIIN